MKIRYVIPLLLAVTAVQAQNQKTEIPKLKQDGVSGKDNVRALVDGNAVSLPRGESYGLKGSPYLDQRWLKTNVQLTNETKTESMLLKYDILEQRLLVRLPQSPNDSIRLNDASVVSFTMAVPGDYNQPAHQQHFRRFMEAPTLEQQLTYVEVVYEGKYTLLKRYSKLKRKANYQGPYSPDQRYDEINDQNQYYLLRPDKTLVLLKLTLKTLQAAAPELALKSVPGAGKASTDVEWAAVLAAAEKK
ncbi:hypothetical protein J7E24_11785 [Hymenobacter sp. ISL-91]|uniref:hypothetical protein n=1 Tax=Hymenobacter sp. ISL-91 TaxID=2819151 RepID=UPI001BE6B126|nr:hypothetical protein [Hymenobacter sp. ISL-91]MBT2558468.1 hypothetical protein [Hymenobacter sp. ISL-91]